MTKPCVLPMFALLAGCTSQQMCGTVVELHNSCPSSINAKVESFSNLGDENPKLIAIGSQQTERVAIYSTPSCDLQETLPANYRLTLLSTEKHVVFNRSTLVKRAVENPKKTIGDVHFWLIESSDLCQ